MEFQIEKKGNYILVRIQGQTAEPDERERLSGSLNNCVSKANYLAVELSRLDYVNSQLLSLFLLAYKAMERKNGHFAIVHPTRRVLDLLRITTLDRIIPIFQDEKTFEQIT